MKFFDDAKILIRSWMARASVLFRSLRRRHGKKAILIPIAALLLVAMIGGTVAFLTTGTPELKNIFTPSEVTCAVVEENWKDGNITKENVQIKNTGDTDAYIRAAIVVTWQNEKGEVLGVAPVKGTDYSITLNENWTFKDGYYYYTKMVPAVDNTETEADERLTANLINTCTVLKAAPADGYTLSVEIIASAIQADQKKLAITDAWGTAAAGLVS